MKFDIKKLYLYSATLIGLIIIVVGSVQLLDLGLKAYVFKDADRYRVAAPYFEPMTGAKYSEEELKRIQAEQQVAQDEEVIRMRKRQASTAISMLIAGIPLYLYHWRLVNKDNS